MSLLSDSRRKQKFSVDPRGLNWSKDESKFGQKLLEKFGWSQGKGLGANENGRRDHVKLNYKDDTKGVGFSKKEENNWIAHQDDFNDLLASLNADHSHNQVPENSVKLQNLEKQSKSSKGRLHYHKFTRGKDLSAKQEEDFDCIFGRYKSKSAPVTPQNNSNETSDEEAENKDSSKTGSSVPKPGLQDHDHGVTTVASSLSVQDYFKQKMEQLKLKRANQSAPNLVTMTTDDDKSHEIKETPQIQTDEPNDDDQHVKKKKKKSKKKKENKEFEKTEDSQFENQSCEENVASKKRKCEEMVDGMQDDKKKDKSKRKRREKVTFCVGDSDEDKVDTAVASCENTDEMADKTVKKKKKKKKSKSKERTDAEDNMTSYPTTEESEAIRLNQALQSDDKKSMIKDKTFKDDCMSTDQTAIEDLESNKMGALKNDGHVRVHKKCKKKKKQKVLERDNVNGDLSERLVVASSNIEGGRQTFPGANWTEIKGYGFS